MNLDLKKNSIHLNIIFFSTIYIKIQPINNVKIYYIIFDSEEEIEKLKKKFNSFDDMIKKLVYLQKEDLVSFHEFAFPCKIFKTKSFIKKNTIKIPLNKCNETSTTQDNTTTFHFAEDIKLSPKYKTSIIKVIEEKREDDVVEKMKLMNNI